MAEGTFSNSATSGSQLFVELFVTKTDVGLFLHEYSFDSAAEKFIGNGTVGLKNENGDKVEVRISGDWNNQGGLRISDGNYSKFINFLEKSTGLIKVVVLEEYGSKYVFSIDTKGFTDEFSQL